LGATFWTIAMIKNRPDYLNDIPYYYPFPGGLHLDIDYKTLPPIFNLDLHQLNGLQPLTKSRFDFIGQNGEVDDKKTSVVFTNPLPEELEYYRQKGTTSFQLISIVFSLLNFRKDNDTLIGMPYAVSLVPGRKRGQVDPWDIELIKHFDLEKTLAGGSIYSEFDPFNGWYGGFYGKYNVLIGANGLNNYSDSIGFVWEHYLSCEQFDSKEVLLLEDSTASATLNAKFRKYRTNLYFEPFNDIKPRKIWGLDSPIELFLLHALLKNNLEPQIQTLVFRNGQIFPNYHKMVEDHSWISQDKLLTNPDFYFQDKKVAIFCDGKEFHTNVENEMRDKKINHSLEELGIRSLRFSGKEISENLESVVETIIKELQ
jgi:hypothetical protein